MKEEKRISFPYALGTSGVRRELRPAPAWVRLAATFIRLLPVGRYRMMHTICRHPPPKFLMRMPAELGGYTFNCNLRDTISREVCFAGFYEPQETALVRSLLQPGMSFVDVGANWGYFTLLAASLVGRRGRVLSLEPDPRLFQILKENIDRNRLDQVMALQLAAASESGTLTLAGYDEGSDNFGVSRLVTGDGEGKGLFQVKADSLDSILEQHDLHSVDLLKMDIEGGEVLALAGLEESLQKRRVKRLLLELHPAQIAELGSSANTLMRKLQAAGYVAQTIDHSSRATRRAAYNKAKDPASWLRPFTIFDELDAWPHQLWTAPGVE